MEANSTSSTYDGQVHEAAGFKTLTFEVDGNTYTVSGITTTDPKSTNVCDVANEINGTAAVKDAAGRGEAVVVVATAAVADWRPAKCAAKKLKKARMGGTLRLVRNPDILKTLSRLPPAVRPMLVGFAAETGDAIAEARRKCREKRLAFIVANDVTERGSGFGTDTDRVTFVFPDGRAQPLPLMTKRAVAGRIVAEVMRIGQKKGVKRKLDGAKQGV